MRQIRISIQHISCSRDNCHHDPEECEAIHGRGQVHRSSVLGNKAETYKPSASDEAEKDGNETVFWLVDAIVFASCPADEGIIEERHDDCRENTPNEGAEGEVADALCGKIVRWNGEELWKIVCDGHI